MIGTTTASFFVAGDRMRKKTAAKKARDESESHGHRRVAKRAFKRKTSSIK